MKCQFKVTDIDSPPKSVNICRFTVIYIKNAEMRM